MHKFFFVILVSFLKLGNGVSEIVRMKREDLFLQTGSESQTWQNTLSKPPFLDPLSEEEMLNEIQSDQRLTTRGGVFSLNCFGSKGKDKGRDKGKKKANGKGLGKGKKVASPPSEDEDPYAIRRSRSGAGGASTSGAGGASTSRAGGASSSLPFTNVSTDGSWTSESQPSSRRTSPPRGNQPEAWPTIMQNRGVVNTRVDPGGARLRMPVRNPLAPLDTNRDLDASRPIPSQPRHRRLEGQENPPDSK